MIQPIGFAVIGTGMIAEVHAQAIRHAGGAARRGLDARGGEARAFAERFGCRAAESLEALVADPEVRAVTIATPSGAHADVAVPFLEAGKAVLCEKPLEVSLAAVDRILDAEQRGGGVLAGVFQMRLGRGARLLKDAVEAGRFGRLTLCSAYVKWWRSPEYYASSPWKGTLEARWRRGADQSRHPRGGPAAVDRRAAGGSERLHRRGSRIRGSKRRTRWPRRCATRTAGWA